MSFARTETASRTAALVGASIPRSGHHFLQTLLSEYYGDRLFYCEVYTKADCCRNVPCTRRGGHEVAYQKSHDRQGELPKDVEGAFYIVQYREPVGEALSDRELDLTDHLGRKSLNYRLSNDHYIWWLALKAKYYRAFHDKWFSPRVKNAIYLDYARLAEDPGTAVAQIVSRTDGSVDRERLAEAVQRASGVRAMAAGQPKKAPVPYSPRKIEESPHFAREMLAAFETFVIEHCPLFGFSPHLGGGPYKDHPFYGLALLSDSEEPLPTGATDRLAAAAALAPAHPEVVLRLAKQDLSEGRPDDAINRLEASIERNAFFAPSYRTLLDAYVQSGRSIAPERLRADSIFACADSPGLLLAIAQSYLDGGMVVNAIATLSMAASLAPDDFRVNHLFAKTLASERRWRQAEVYARKAAILKPDSKASERLSLRIQKQLGIGPTGRST